MKNKVSFAEKDERLQDLVRCKVKIYKLSTMQRCPYIHEMKERLLGEQIPTEASQKKIPTPPPFIMDQSHNQQTVATVVKLNPDGYGSHTSPTHHRNDRTPLMPKESEDDFHYVERSMYPKNAKTSLFIIMSFVYAKLLVVVCVAYVISDVVTHNIPLFYYEGFFTYLYGMSILFLLYVFCFLLQESTCCSGGNETPPVKPKQDKALQKKQAKEKEKERKKEEERKKKEDEKKKKEEKEKLKKEKKEKDKEKEKDKDKKTKKQEKREKFPRKMRDIVQQRAPLIQEQQPPPAAPPAPLPPTPSTPCTQGCDVEAGNVARPRRKRKTTQSDQSYGSFFLRIGAIAFGLGTMIYNGLEFGSFFEIPFTSPCYMILQGVNPVLQMVFTFMQMYFIFMNSRLNIHRFKVIARFGLMHVVATNICVWIRTLVLEYINEVTLYHKKFFNHTGITAGVPQIAESVVQHTLRNAPTILHTHVRVPDVLPISTAGALTIPTTTVSPLRDLFRVTNRVATTTLAGFTRTFPTTTTRRIFTNPPTYPTFPTKAWKYVQTTFTTRPFTTTQSTTSKLWRAITSTAAPIANQVPFYPRGGFNNFEANNVVNVAEERDADTETVVQSGIDTGVQSIIEAGIKALNGSELMDDITPQAYTSFNSTMQVINGTTSCGRVNIMGTIVKDSAPYLFPFIIEYSLIGAAVIYVMWKHIGQNPRYITEEDLEHRLEIMLSRRAVAMAHAQQVRVDCVGASKGLFFGLLMLVGSLICLILFFVLIQHPDFGLLAIYLADVSHCVLMVLSIIAIIIGFIRVQSLKFKTEEQNDLNDILLRVSAFGLFLYAVFSVIAGHLNAFTNEPNLLVMVTGVLAIVQVTLQLLFIADVSRRRVHLPEHDRSKPGRQVVTFLLICNVTMWIIYTFEVQKVEANPVQLEFYGFLAWAIVQRVCLPLCIFHRFHSAVALAEIWKGSYKARLE